MPDAAATAEAAFQGCAAWFAEAGWPPDDFEEAGMAAVDRRMEALLSRAAACTAASPAAAPAAATCVILYAHIPSPFPCRSQMCVCGVGGGGGGGGRGW